MKGSAVLLRYTPSKAKRMVSPGESVWSLRVQGRGGKGDAADGMRQNKTEHLPTLRKGQGLETTGMSAAWDEARTGLECPGEQGAKQ